MRDGIDRNQCKNIKISCIICSIAKHGLIMRNLKISREKDIKRNKSEKNIQKRSWKWNINRQNKYAKISISKMNRYQSIEQMWFDMECLKKMEDKNEKEKTNDVTAAVGSNGT